MKMIKILAASGRKNPHAGKQGEYGESKGNIYHTIGELNHVISMGR